MEPTSQAKTLGTKAEQVRVCHLPLRYKVGAMATKSGTVSIGAKQAARTFHAVRFANDNGRTLNLFVTIDFTSLGIDPNDASATFRQVWARFSRWYADQRDRKGRPFGRFDAYAVHEHPTHGPRHVHWVMRAPEGTEDEIERVIRNRLEKLTGLACLGSAIDFRPVYSAGQLAKYTLKGIAPAYARHFHMTAEDQGFVTGRRITISRSIGYAARQRAGWVRKRK